jgi:hypothetical protein
MGANFESYAIVRLVESIDGKPLKLELQECYTYPLVDLFSGQLFGKGIRGVFHSGHDRSIS